LRIMPKGELMLDYLRLSPMIGGGSLSLKANERTTTREREGRHYEYASKATRNYR
jgi:hypothetical protein